MHVKQSQISHPSGSLRTDESGSLEGDLIERTSSLSLADALVAAATFKPSNPCVPSDPQIISALLSTVPSEPNFFDLRTETSGLFDDLQKFASKLARRGSARSATACEEVLRVQLKERAFEVVEKLGEGGFGAVFMAKEVGDRQADYDELDDDEEQEAAKFALKVVKPRNIWEYHALRRIHHKLSETCRTSIILPHAAYAFRDESFLLMELRTQGTLLDVVNHANEAGVTQQGGCLDELLVMFFAIELMKFIEAMHSSGFIHGDFKIDNCLLRLEEVPGGSSAWSAMYQSSGEGGWKFKGVKMIDFGRAIDTTMFSAGQQFIADWKTDAGDCVEMRQGKPWTYQVDYHGLAGIVYCMLFGKYFDASTVVQVSSDPSAKLKLAAQFRRYWQVDLWTRFFDALLNSTCVKDDGSLPICTELSSMRLEMETWLASNCNRASNSLKGLLKKIEKSLLS